MKSLRIPAVLMFVFLIAAAVPMFAGPVPSKTAPDQTLAERSADLATVKTFTEMEGVSSALAAQGFTQAQIDSKLASLSDEELSSLASNLQQIEAAGLTREQWTWIGIGALAALLLVVLL